MVITGSKWGVPSSFVDVMIVCVIEILHCALLPPPHFVVYDFSSSSSDPYWLSNLFVKHTVWT